MNIAKLTDWAMRLDHPPWTASKGRGKQRFRRILTPLDRSQSPFMAAANLFANVAGIFEDRIDAQLKLHPELSVDSKVRREQWAKDHGINLTM